MPNEAIKPLARSTDLVTKEVADEVLIYDPKTHKAHCLNKTAFLAWSYCDGATTITELASQMSKELDAPVSEDIVWLSLEQMGRADLLQQRLTKPENLNGISRRRALRTLAATVTIPLITTIIAPQAAMAATCRGANQPGNALGCTCNGNGNCTSNCCNLNFPNGPNRVCLTTGLALNQPCERNCQCQSGDCGGTPRRCRND